MTASTTYGSAQFQDAMKGTVLKADPSEHTVTTSSGAENGNFARFADLARKVAQVPKGEVNEQRQKA